MERNQKVGRGSSSSRVRERGDSYIHCGGHVKERGIERKVNAGISIAYIRGIPMVLYV